MQALTDTFNYSFRCLVETKVYIFNLEVITLRVLKLPVILVYYVSSLSFLFSKNTFKTSGPTHKNIYTDSRNKSLICKTHFKCLSFTGVSSALNVLFVFPVQALTCTFNYSFHCLVETKVYFFHLEVITLRVLKLPVILVYYVSSLSFLFSKNTFKTSGPTHKNIYTESRNKSLICKNTF